MAKVISRDGTEIAFDRLAVAYFQVSFPLSFWPSTNWGVPAVLDCFLFLYFMFAGAGPWSIDAMIAGRRAVTRID